MVQDVGYDFAAGPSVTLISSDITTGNVSGITAAVDFGTPTPFEIGFEWIMTTLTSCVDYVHLEIAWSHDNSDFSDLTNMETVASMLCEASVDKKKIGSFITRARYAKFRINNQSGGSIDGTASNSALVLFDIFHDQA